MHNTSSGLLKHLLDLTETALQNSSQHEDIQERLKLVPSFMELHLLAKRLAAKYITAAQRHSLGACMPVCLVGLVDMEPYIAAFTGRAAQRCLRPACMTAASSQLTTTSHVCGRCGQQRPRRPSSRYNSAWYRHVVGLAQACLHAVWTADCLHPQGSFTLHDMQKDEGPRRATYKAHVDAALLEWVDLRHMRLHTQASLDALREARIRWAGNLWQITLQQQLPVANSSRELLQ